MAFPQGINFRTTVGFVTDGADEDAEARASGLGANYPRVTAQGNTVGWEIDVTHITRDRASGNDRRLAGFNGNNDTAAVITYRIDLPAAASYQINWAAGDANYATGAAVDLYDGATLKQSLSTGVTSAANRFKDATNVERTNVTWPTDNVAVTVDFATSILRLTCVPNGANTMCYAHVRVESVPVLSRRYLLSPM